MKVLYIEKNTTFAIIIVKVLNQKINKMNKSKLLITIGLIVLAVLSRILPHPLNFSPIGAVAIFSAMHLNKRVSFLIPFLSLWLSDFVLNNWFYHQFYQGSANSIVWFANEWVYIAFAVIYLLTLLIKFKVKVSNLVIASLTSSVVFFLLTNFGVWLSGFYPMTASGLVACYTAALPFFQNTLLGDLFYVSVLFGIYEWYSRTFTALKSA